MERMILIARDSGRTRYVLDIDPRKVRLVNRHTLSVPRPDWWQGNDGEKRVEIDSLVLMRMWYDHADVELAELGIEVVEITERGRRLKRAAPWEAGVIPLFDDEDLSTTLPMTMKLKDGTVRKVLVRIPDFRQVRPWGLIVPHPPDEEDAVPLLLSPEMIYKAALDGQHGLKLLGVFPVHTTN